ncbi:YraN family protein [Lacisediminimonas sp.]|uniref:YraN family protein n=1 Tax=Lacisediminimonas sp. TaxID=3060582 RepID=UPI002722E3A3|nr:YraN family protein [Lacisediminimonas sp.]MDO8299399.1 YraN family protein [Lacisediminimonas sp.]
MSGGVPVKTATAKAAGAGSGTTSPAANAAPPGAARGREAEDRALRYLLSQGLSLVTRNFRCRGGEIDLIMQHGRELVFVEVRFRSSASHGGALASITSGKQAKMVLAAQLFLQRYRQLPACRFDVVAIEGTALHWLRAVISL